MTSLNLIAIRANGLPTYTQVWNVERGDELVAAREIVRRWISETRGSEAPIVRAFWSAHGTEKLHEIDIDSLTGESNPLGWDQLKPWRCSLCRSKSFTVPAELDGTIVCDDCGRHFEPVVARENWTPAARRLAERRSGDAR